MNVVRTQDAVGHVLCHDLTRIVRGESKGPAFKKGHVVRAEDIELLLSMGKESLYVWEKPDGMLHENEAAQVLYEICAGDSKDLRPSDPSEGKIDVYAETDGLLKLDLKRLRALNSQGEMMIAARHGNFPVRRGDKLAGTRVIPLTIESAKMEQARSRCEGAPVLSIKPFKHKRVGIVTTGSEVSAGRIEDTFTPVLRDKLAEYDTEMIGHCLPGDDSQAITDAILSMIGKGAELVLCSGGMSVDPDDRTPLAIKNTGARIVSYGAPVLPGAMFLLAYQGAVPIVGLPGCVMYAKRTIFDLVLPRLLADDEVTADDLCGLGAGGLCLDCDICTFPNCGFGKGV